MDRPGYEADADRHRPQPGPTATSRRLTEDWDRSSRARLVGRRADALRAGRGHRPAGLFAIDVATGAVTPIVAEGHVYAGEGRRRRRLLQPRLARRPRPSCTSSSTAGTAGSPGSTRQRLRGVALGEPEQFTFAGWNGETVYGYVVKPADFDPAKKYPGRLPHPRRPAGHLRQRLPLPLEPAGLRRRRLRRGDDRLPRLDRLRPGVHRRDQRRLGRQAARGPEEGPRRRARRYPCLDGPASPRWAPPTAAT